MQRRRAFESRPWQRSVVFGVLVGGAAAVKLTGAAILAVPIVWHVAEIWRGNGRVADTARSLAIYSIFALSVALPFYLRPWMLTGDPFYPYYAPWFSDNPARFEMSRYHHALGSAFGVRGPVAFFFGPVLLAFDKDIFDGDFGWQFLIVIGLAAVAVARLRTQRGEPIVGLLAAAFVGLYIFWYLTAQQARFAIPAAVAVLLLAAIGLERFHGAQRKLILVVLIVAAAVCAPWRDAGHYLGSWMSVVGMISQSKYVDVSTDENGREYMALIRAIDDETPRDANVMLLFEHRGFYVPRRHTIGTPLFQEAVFTPPRAFGNAERVRSVLRREQITHVVMTHQQRGPDLAPTWRESLEPFLTGIQDCLDEGDLRPIWESKQYALLEVVGARERAPAGSP
jgi:hypothetical protein